MSTNVFSMKVQILETLFFVSPTRDGTNILLGARAVWCFSTCHTVTVLFFVHSAFCSLHCHLQRTCVNFPLLLLMLTRNGNQLVIYTICA